MDTKVLFSVGDLIPPYEVFRAWVKVNANQFSSDDGGLVIRELTNLINLLQRSSETGSIPIELWERLGMVVYVQYAYGNRWTRANTEVIKSQIIEFERLEMSPVLKFTAAKANEDLEAVYNWYRVAVTAKEWSQIAKQRKAGR